MSDPREHTPTCAAQKTHDTEDCDCQAQVALREPVYAEVAGIRQLVGARDITPSGEGTFRLRPQPEYQSITGAKEQIAALLAEREAFRKELRWFAEEIRSMGRSGNVSQSTMKRAAAALLLVGDST